MAKYGMSVTAPKDTFTSGTGSLSPSAMVPSIRHPDNIKNDTNNMK